MNENIKNNKFVKKGLALMMVGAVSFGGAYGAYSLNNSNQVVIQSATTAKTTATTTSSSSLSTEQLAKNVVPSVVAITTENVTTSNYWFGQQVESGAGSGVILSSDGYILTCAHVINGADNINVEISDGKTYQATVIGSDTSNDIAVIKIDASDLTAVTFGDSDDVNQGESSYAVGNPEGNFSGSITEGIISAVNREISVSVETESENATQQGFSNMRQSATNTQTITLTVLQTDAAVSPGNSGGGLFNSDGELIGIVSAKSSDTDSEGLGFAIPSNTALSIAKTLINNQ